jgi:hypothetical protein
MYEAVCTPEQVKLFQVVVLDVDASFPPSGSTGISDLWRSAPLVVCLGASSTSQAFLGHMSDEAGDCPATASNAETGRPENATNGSPALPSVPGDII